MGFVAMPAIALRHATSGNQALRVRCMLFRGTERNQCRIFHKMLKHRMIVSTTAIDTVPADLWKRLWGYSPELISAQYLGYMIMILKIFKIKNYMYIAS